MKIWKMNEADWVAAETLAEAKQCLADCIADGKVDAAFEEEFIENPEALSEEDLDDLIFTDTDDDENLVDQRTFREQLGKLVAEGEKFPAFFASTEF